MAARKLYIDRQNQKLVIYPGEGGVTTLAPLYQGNNQQFEITVVEPTGLQASPYSKVNLASATLRVSIGSTPTGTAGGPTPLALQTSWTYDSTNNKFTGSIALNTAAIDSHIGTAASATAYFEINLVESGERETIFQTAFTLKAVVDEATSTAPTPTDTYLTRNESLAMFVKKQGDAGDAIILRNAAGTFEVTLYCDVNGNLAVDSNPV